jgi:hypothetical protein
MIAHLANSTPEKQRDPRLHPGTPEIRIQDAMGAGGETAKLVASINRAIDRSSLMQKHHDDSKACLTAFVQDNTVIAVIEVTAA